MVPRQSSRTISSFQSDIESNCNSIPELTEEAIRSPISELAVRLRERVQMEQRSGRQDRPSVEELLFQHTESSVAEEEIKNNQVQIEGMDLLLQALHKSTKLNSDVSSATSSDFSDDDSCDTDTTTSHEPDDSQLRTRGGGPQRRRCQILSRQTIGAQLHLPSELTVDSLRLARTCMNKKHEGNDHNAPWDKITFDTVEFEDDPAAPQMETILVKDASRASLLSQKSLSSTNTILSNPFHRSFGNAAA